ncbi:MAG: hypothetical protein AB1403_25380 [Candidatus Riflebacteria bacterium]
MMSKETFSVRIDQLQPSQTYISQARLDNISRHVQFLSRPVPVRKINGRLCIVEGHERCFALHSMGETNVQAYLDSKPSPEESCFKQMVKYAADSGIASIADFEDRILNPAEFRVLWLAKKKDFLCQENAAAVG